MSNEKKSLRKHIILRFAKLVHILISASLFGACLVLYYGAKADPSQKISFLSIGVFSYFIVMLLLFRIYDGYSVGSHRVSRLLYSHALAFFMVTVISYFVISIAFFRLVNPLPLFIVFAAQMLFTLLWTLYTNHIYFKLSPPKDTVILYGDDSEFEKIKEIERTVRKFNVKKYIKVGSEFDSILPEILDAEVVFLVGIELDLRNELAKACVTKNIRCYILPCLGDVIINGADTIHTFSVPFYRLKRAAPDIEYLIIKRAFDIVTSLVAIILASPIMLVTAIAVKVYDGGPVFYKQVRLTKNGRHFKVLKFRSMRTDAEKDGVARLSSANDDRITPVGKVIRKIRFDELPQLFNILKGEMSIVGPRPERPEIAEQYEREIPSFSLRLQVKAGLTGYAQVYGRYNTEPKDKLKMDLMYINKMSVSEDIKLMLATVKILFLPESTEGVAAGQTTASSQSQKSEEKEIKKV